MEKIAVVINAGAGQGHGRELEDQIVAAFARHGLSAQVSLAGEGGEVAQAVRAALAQGARTVVGGGGDGTINQVASTLLEDKGECALGVLPLGTLNHFA